MTAYIELQAINPDNKIARYYNVYISKDMFDQWSILIYHGRIGFKGRHRQCSYPSIDQMNKKLRIILRKRSKATKRIGCNYELKSLQVEKLPEVHHHVELLWPHHLS